MWPLIFMVQLIPTVSPGVHILLLSVAGLVLLGATTPIIALWLALKLLKDTG
jgi:hypothetical protein